MKQAKPPILAGSKPKGIIPRWGRWLRQNPLSFYVIAVSLVLADVVFPPAPSDVRVLSFFIVYYILRRYLGLKSAATFRVTLVLLVAMIASFAASGPSDRTERLAVWIVLLMGFGLIQQWREARS